MSERQVTAVTTSFPGSDADEGDEVSDAIDPAIRPAERADLLAVVRIEDESFSQPWPYDAFERFLGEPGFLVATAPTPMPVSSATSSQTPR